MTTATLNVSELPAVGQNALKTARGRDSLLAALTKRDRWAMSLIVRGEIFEININQDQELPRRLATMTDEQLTTVVRGNIAVTAW